MKITADMYSYTAGATGLASTMPPWVLDGGYEAAYKQFRDPATRRKIADAMRTPSDEWENMFVLSGSPDRILLISFRSDKLKPFTGKTLAEVAKLRGQDPTEAVMDLITEDQSRIGTVYFLMSEENVKKQIALPWVSFGSAQPGFRSPPASRRASCPRRLPTPTSIRQAAGELRSRSQSSCPKPARTYTMASPSIRGWFVCIAHGYTRAEDVNSARWLAASGVLALPH